MQLLPYVEQGNLYNQIMSNSSYTPTFNEAIGAYGTQVKSYLCPADSSTTTARTDRANTGGYTCGSTNYTPGLSGATDGNGLDDGNGCFFRSDGIYAVNPTKYRRTLRLEHIGDGTANTFMIGEDVAEKNQHCGWPNSNYSTGTCAIPLNYAMPTGSPDWNNPGNWPNVYSFRSRHTGGANFCMADGGVRFVTENITLNTYRALATINGGEVANLP